MIYVTEYRHRYYDIFQYNKSLFEYSSPPEKGMVLRVPIIFITEGDVVTPFQLRAFH